MFPIMLSSLVTATALCGDLQLPPGSICEPVGPHLIVSESADDVPSMREDLLQASTMFGSRFDHPAPPTVVSTVTLDQAQYERLQAAGYRSVAPWLSSANVLRQVSESLGGLDIGKKQMMAIVEGLRSSTPLTHELGHLWMRNVYWPGEDEMAMRRSAGTSVGAHGGAEIPRVMRYGSDAPDWFDELAAVMNEPDTLAVLRRGQFAGLVSTGALPDLDVWLSIEHPAHHELKQSGRELQSGVVVVVRTEEQVKAQMEAAKAAGNASPINESDYYSIARGVIDFIDARAKLRPYDAIARHIASGGDFDQWLREHGADFGLPGTRAEFKREFEAWAKATHGTPAAN